MGTRYEDQPAEHWAGPESLDPTPVWKQYALIALLLVVGLIVVVATAFTALAPQLVTPPAIVFGDRLVLSTSELPPAGAPPRLISTPIVTMSDSFWLAQPQKGEVVAFRQSWRPRSSEPMCQIFAVPSPGERATYIAANCATFAPQNPGFDAHGAPLDGQPRGLDQYLVSVSGDRAIVNLSRVIEASERTNAPVPTGIPQPQATP